VRSSFFCLGGLAIHVSHLYGPMDSRDSPHCCRDDGEHSESESDCVFHSDRSAHFGAAVSNLFHSQSIVRQEKQREAKQRERERESEREDERASKYRAERKFPSPCSLSIGSSV
jgi:hypothetical protein